MYYRCRKDPAALLVNNLTIIWNVNENKKKKPLKLLRLII